MSLIRNRKHAVNSYALVMAAATALVLPVKALADEQADHGDKSKDRGSRELIVKGDKRQPYKAESANPKATASLLDTPQTVAVITDQLIREQAATTLTEALRNSPGVGTFYLGENGNTSTGDAIFVRGSDASGSIFIDGVRDVASVSRDTFNIEQVEVLKGAAGADIGRGAATGAINLVTKRPVLRNMAFANIGVGEGDYARGTFDFNLKLDKTTALRINLLTQDAGVAGRNAVTNKRWGIAPTIGFGVGTKTRLFLGTMHIQQDNIPDGGVLTIGLPGYSTPNPGTRDFLNTAAPVDPSTFYGTKDDHDTITADTVSAIFEHDFSETTSVTNVTRWSQTDQEYQLSSFMAGPTQLVTPNVNDPNTWTATRNVNNKNATNTTLTNQTNLQTRFNTGFIAHSISTGIEFIREEQTSHLYAVTGAYPAFSLYHPNPNVSGYVRQLSGAYNQGTIDTIGLYYNDTMKLNEQWLVTVGLRNDNYEVDYDAIPATGVVPPTIKAEGNLFSGRAGLSYKPVPNGTIYASYAITKQPPGGATFTLTATTTTNANNPNVDPQEAKTSEIGTKWNLLDNHLGLTAALYKTEYSDTIALDTDGSYYRTGEKSVKGIELGAVGQITRAWNVSAGYTVMDSEVKNAPLVTADGSPNLTYNPSDSGSLWTTYTVNRDLTIGGGLNYNGEMKRGTDGAVGTPKFVKSYIVYNGLIKYRLNRKVELQLNAYNLFDKVYAASINKSGYRYTPGVPRSVRLTANLSF